MDSDRNYVHGLLKISLKNIRPLKDIALDCVARNTCDHDPRLAHGQSPEHLKNKIEAYKCETGELTTCYCSPANEST